MNAPRVETEPFITIDIELRPTPVGRTPFGDRREVFFDGVATSELWDGEWAVNGVDHIVVGDGGVVRIDVHVTMTGDGEVLTYRGHGRAGPDGVIEGVTFETPTQRLAELNTTVAIGRAVLDGDRLHVSLFRISP